MLRNYLSAVFLLFSFLSILMCCAICEAASAQNSAGTPDNKITLFEPTKTNFKKNGGTGGETTYESFTSPSLSYVGDLLVVFAQAKNSNGKCDIVEGYFKIEDNGSLADKDGDASTAGWKKRLTKNDDDNKCADDPTTVADKDNIYLFFKNSDGTDSNIKYQIFKGNTFNEIDSKKGIKWGFSPKDLKDELNSAAKEPNQITSVASGNSGIVVKGTFVVPVLYTKSTGDFASIITKTMTTVDSTEWDFVLSKKPFVEKMYLAVAEWDSKLIMMTSSKEGLHKVYESADMGKNWAEAVGSLSNMWGKKEEESTLTEQVGRNGFITVQLVINNKEEKVMLFTKPVKNNGKYDLHLWMSDCQRVYDVGAIATEIKQNVFSSLLYKTDKLFVAYDKVNEGGTSTIYAAPLNKQLDDVKRVLSAWTNQNTFLSEYCYGTDLALTKEQCTDNTNKILTNDLVGFLSGNYDSSNKKWIDEFLCVNATVTVDGTNLPKVDKGLRFNGTGAGATWPVNKQEQSQRYYFSNNGFTLLATVKIDSDANKNSVLGIGFGGTKKSIGVWCDKGKWSVTDGTTAEETITKNPCVKEKIYHVALILKENNKFNVYIGKGKEGILTDRIIDAQEPLSITHFYFGAENTQSTNIESHVTVTNVLLYNRPFEQGEIEKLKEYAKSVEVVTPPNGNTTPQEGGNDEVSPTQLSTNENEKKDGKEPSPSRTEDGGLGGGVRVFSLLLPLLCVSVLLLHL